MTILPQIEQVNDSRQVSFIKNAVKGSFSDQKELRKEEQNSKSQTPLERLKELNELSQLRSYFVSISSDNYRKSYRSVKSISESGKRIGRGLKLNSLKAFVLRFLS